MAQRASSVDMVYFVTMVCVKRRNILKKFTGKKPKEIEKQEVKLLEVMDRFNRDQYWHEDSEVSAIHNYASWILALSAAQNSVPYRPFPFNPKNMVAKVAPTLDVMRKAMADAIYGPGIEPQGAQTEV